MNLVARSGGKGRTGDPGPDRRAVRGARALLGHLLGRRAAEGRPRYEALGAGRRAHPRPRALQRAPVRDARRVQLQRLREHPRRARRRWTRRRDRLDAGLVADPRSACATCRRRYCYYGFPTAAQFFTRCDSNGCAAGSTLEEAILYGFLELVERDGVALWWYNRVRRPARGRRPASRCPYWDEMQRYYRDELGRELRALDLTTDLGIPVVRGRLAAAGRRAVEDVIVGFAAHLDPRVALPRALQEANQYLPAAAPRRRRTARRAIASTTRRRSAGGRRPRYANQPYLVPDPTAAPSEVRGLPAAWRRATSSGTWRRVCGAAAARGPGDAGPRPDAAGRRACRSRASWSRVCAISGGGWLRGGSTTCPVKLGWLARALAEDELNPISCFV